MYKLTRKLNERHTLFSLLFTYQWLPSLMSVLVANPCTIWWIGKYFLYRYKMGLWGENYRREWDCQSTTQKCLVDSRSIFCQAFSFSPLQAKINQWTYFGPTSKTSPIACTQDPWKEEGLDSRHVSSCPSLKHMLHEYLGSDSNKRTVCQRH